MRLPIVWLALSLTCLCNSAHSDVIFDFDYSHDTGFFAVGSQARSTLEAAGNYFQSILGDTLSAITPGGGNSWSGSYFNPSNGNSASFNGSISANTLKIFVGARDLPGNTLGQAGPGGLGISGINQAWFDTVIARGQPGALLGTPTDFGPWGGSLVIDNNSTWNFNHTVAPTAGQNDLYSVILHELGHVLGYGTSGSWNALVQGNQFTGVSSVATNGGNINLDGSAHWIDGTMSTVNGNAQEAAMDPSIFTGTRKLFTELDLAGLRDIGWQVNNVPEPSSLSLILIGGVFLVNCRRRKVEA